MTKLHLQGGQYSRTMFTKQVQVTAVRHVIDFAHIYSEFPVATESSMLEGLYLDLPTMDGRITTGNRTAGIFQPVLNIVSFVSRYLVLFYLTRTCKWWKIPLMKCTVFTDDVLQKDTRRQMEKGSSEKNHTQLLASYPRLSKACGRARPLKMDIVPRQHVPTFTY